MARRTKREAVEEYDETTATPEETPMTSVITKKELPVRQVKRPLRKVSFEQWARSRGIKPHHKGGLKAFAGNADLPRTLEAWDKLFAEY